MPNFSKPEDAPVGWHNRGYLPHFDGGEICQFVSFHLGDALPRGVIERWKTQLDGENNAAARIKLYRRIEKYLDEGGGECWLQKKEIAETVRESLLRFDGVRYKLIAWVIMPNHIHFLIKPVNGRSLSEIIKKFKSYTAHEANKILRRSGRFWQADYFDRYIRSYEHFIKTVDYIENNPVKAGLCEKPSDWKFSSAS